MAPYLVARIRQLCDYWEVTYVGSAARQMREPVRRAFATETEARQWMADEAALLGCDYRWHT